MEIAFGLLGIGLAVLGLVLAYIWKSNGQLQEKMATNQVSMTQVLERIEEGQRKGFKALEEGQRKGFYTLGKMLENQTKILERIEGKLPRTYAGQD